MMMMMMMMMSMAYYMTHVEYSTTRPSVCGSLIIAIMKLRCSRLDDNGSEAGTTGAFDTSFNL
eukprot:COSAG05_NODE_86_length_20511_cov_71.945277_10_plen_63_part_00